MTAAISLRENPDVLKLLESMKTPKLKPQQQGFIALLEYTDTLTVQYNSILDELNDLKECISGIADKKSPLAIMVENLETLAADVSEKLQNLKDGIVSFTKNALEAVKEKGLSALGSVFSFLHVKDGLQAMSKACAKSVEALDKAVARCDSIEKHCKEKTAEQISEEIQSSTAQTVTLADLLKDTRVDFENLTPDELKAVYGKLLAIGMDNDLTTNENACLQYLTEEAESLLPNRSETETAPEAESELNQGEEL